MSELLKPLQQGGDDESGSGGALAGFASESLAQAISERGGFGIADRILHQLEHQPKPSTGTSATNAAFVKKD